MNVWDIALLVLLAAAVVFALRRILRARRNGGCSCGSCSGCSGACERCASRGSCGARKEKDI